MIDDTEDGGLEASMATVTDTEWLARHRELEGALLAPDGSPVGIPAYEWSPEPGSA